MRIAVIYPATILVGWNVADGIPRTLRNMGHKVTEFPRGRRGQPRLSAGELNGHDLVLASGAEYLFLAESSQNVLGEISLDEWKAVKVPKFAWYHESFFRDDRVFPFKRLEPLFDEHFFPACQDATMFGQRQFGAEKRCHWLPFGVDTEVFKPTSCGLCKGGPGMAECRRCLGSGFENNEKSVDIGFIGSVYGARNMYLDRLAPHLNGISLLIGNVVVQDIEGVSPEETVERLAANYRKIKVFFNLISLSRLLVTKVHEVMACGTFLMTPGLEGQAEKNMDPFTHTKHLIYYRPTNLPFVAQMLREFLERDLDRELIAAAGCKEVRERHSLAGKLNKILGVLSKEEKKEQVTA